jgi:hypothetical protein
MTDPQDIAAAVIARLRAIQDIAEQVGRLPGDLHVISRRDLDDIADNARAAARLTREREEHLS